MRVLPGDAAIRALLVAAALTRGTLAFADYTIVTTDGRRIEAQDPPEHRNGRVYYRIRGTYTLLSIPEDSLDRPATEGANLKPPANSAPSSPSPSPSRSPSTTNGANDGPLTPTGPGYIVVRRDKSTFLAAKEPQYADGKVIITLAGGSTLVMPEHDIDRKATMGANHPATARSTRDVVTNTDLDRLPEQGSRNAELGAQRFADALKERQATGQRLTETWLLAKTALEATRRLPAEVLAQHPSALRLAESAEREAARAYLDNQKAFATWVTLNWDPRWKLPSQAETAVLLPESLVTLAQISRRRRALLRQWAPSLEKNPTPDDEVLVRELVTTAIAKNRSRERGDDRANDAIELSGLLTERMTYRDKRFSVAGMEFSRVTFLAGVVGDPRTIDVEDTTLTVSLRTGAGEVVARYKWTSNGVGLDETMVEEHYGVVLSDDWRIDRIVRVR